MAIPLTFIACGDDEEEIVPPTEQPGEEQPGGEEPGTGGEDVPVAQIVVGNGAVTFTVGDDALAVAYTVQPADATDKTVTATSSAPAVCTAVINTDKPADALDDIAGYVVITPRGEGTATVTLASQGTPEVTTAITVTVKAAEKPVREYKPNARIKGSDGKWHKIKTIDYYSLLCDANGNIIRFGGWVYESPNKMVYEDRSVGYFTDIRYTVNDDNLIDKIVEEIFTGSTTPSDVHTYIYSYGPDKRLKQVVETNYTGSVKNTYTYVWNGEEISNVNMVNTVTGSNGATEKNTTAVRFYPSTSFWIENPLLLAFPRTCYYKDPLGVFAYIGMMGKGPAHVILDYALIVDGKAQPKVRAWAEFNADGTIAADDTFKFTYQ